MLLKTLSLVGFKSFANRTRLDFEAGVNVVVGPNGSGKSNLLDAIAWVMGTQATTVLRTQKMDDVIFAGTATRPSLGRAEVIVTFDNTDRFLPFDLDEISMTRRLYRDGTSEYELNGASCRLLDLHEILSDGGVGRHQHVLVSQGQIGEILSARPDEHRAVVEEAAGVTKHRGRRDRSLRRLEQTELDVERLNDILLQERRRLGPLKRQANAAARHQSVRDEIRALRLWLGGAALRSMQDRQRTAMEEKASLDAAIIRDGEELEELLASLEALRSDAGEVGHALERDTAAAARLETTAERLQKIAMVARERRSALRSRLENAGQRRTDLESELAQLQSSLEALESEHHNAQAMAQRREVTLHALEDEERALAEQAQLPAEGLLANLRGDLRALEVAAERDARELHSLARRREIVETRLREEQTQAESIVAEIQQVDVGVVDAQERYENAKEAADIAREAREQVKEADRIAQIAVARTAAQVEALEAAIAGLGDPEARRRASEADGVIGPVVSQLDVPVAIAPAVGAALGAWADALVTSGPDAMHAVSSTLKSEGFGGVTLLVGAVSSGDGSVGAVAAEFGGEALVDRLGSAASRHLAMRLLGDVVIVEGWTTGWKLVQKHPLLRAVTPEGDLISVNGMRLADADGAGHAALEAASVEHEIAQRDAARARSRLSTADRDHVTRHAAEEAALENLQRLEAHLAGLTEALAINGRARAEGDAEIVRLDERARALSDAEKLRSQRMTEIRRQLNEFEGEEKKRQEAWERLNRRRLEVATRRSDAQRLRDEATAAVVSSGERLRLSRHRIEAIVTELQTLGVVPHDSGEIDALEETETRARRSADIVRSHIETLRGRQLMLRRQAGLADDRLSEAYDRQRELERSVSTAKDRVSQRAIELAELRVKLESVAEGLRRDADAGEEEALAAPRPHLDDNIDPNELLAAREAELKRMGPINPLAAAEYEEMAGHVELLESQLGDLEESRRELRKVIKALDEEMASLFLKAFDEISALYQENFGLVFPGGRGRLRLTDPDDLLNTGIEIDAQPHGKKVGRLSLLSGGERSLAALAFLFAVFRARPSPFYVLDEVEAALDDANLRRFLRLVDTLRESAQLVIITHQQQTMEAADILYGVTMEPGESSQVLSKRLERAPAGHR